jgi:glycosyltransferase involved in cell wall biosynthesis
VDLSVVLPAFNGERFIRDAVESVLREPAVTQLIVVDDASKDSTSEIVASLAKSEPRIHLVAFDTNQGVAAARNRGVSLAGSKWLSFIDQDDMWVNSRTHILRKLAGKESHSLGIGRVRHFLEPGEFSEKAPSWIRQQWVDDSLPGWVLGATVCSLETFKKVGPLDETLRQGTDDFEWFARAQQLGVTTVAVDEVILSRRLHSHNQSSKSRFGPELTGIIRNHLKAKGKESGHDG